MQSRTVKLDMYMQPLYLYDLMYTFLNKDVLFWLRAPLFFLLSNGLAYFTMSCDERSSFCRIIIFC